MVCTGVRSRELHEPILENRSIGLLDQIDQILGNSDGWIDESEANSFSELVVSSRNWTDSFSGGCCAFDYSSMSVVGSIDVSVNPPEMDLQTELEVNGGGRRGKSDWYF